MDPVSTKHGISTSHTLTLITGHCPIARYLNESFSQSSIG